MGLFDAATVAAALLVFGFGVRYIDPAVLDRLARETGFGARIGWTAYLLAVGVVVAPLATGASVDGDGVWAAGSAVSAAEVYLLAVAASSVDEYRALGRAREVEVTPPRPGDEPVAVTGTPDPEADAAARFSGMAAVHADWLVQERDRAASGPPGGTGPAASGPSPSNSGGHGSSPGATARSAGRRPS